MVSGRTLRSRCSRRRLAQRSAAALTAPPVPLLLQWAWDFAGSAYNLSSGDYQFEFTSTRPLSWPALPDDAWVHG